MKKSIKETLVDYAKTDGRGALDAVRTLEMFVVILLEPATILTALGTAAVCGAIQQSGLKLIDVIWKSRHK